MSLNGEACLRMWAGCVVVALCFTESLLLSPTEGFGDAPLYGDPQLMVDAEGFTGVPIQRLALSNDGQWLAAAGEKVVRVWNLKTSELHATLRGYQEPYGYHVGYIDAVAFSPDSRFLAVGVSDNTEYGSTRLYDLQRPEEVHRLVKGHLGCTRGVAFTPDGRTMATWGCDGNIIFMRWNARKGDAEELFRIYWKTSSVDWPDAPDDVFKFSSDGQWLLFSKLGRHVLVSMRDQAEVMDLNQWPRGIRNLPTQITALRQPGGDQSSITSDLALRVSSTGSDGRLWRVAGGKTPAAGNGPRFWVAAWGSGSNPVAVHEHGFDPVSVAWNEAAGIAASADQLGQIHVWEPQTGRNIIPPLKPNNRRIWDVAWSDDGQKLFYADQNYGGNRYHYNRFGTTNKEFNLPKGLLQPTTTTVEDDAVFPELKLPDGGLQIRPIQDSGGGTSDPYDLHIVHAESGNSINLLPWRDDDRLAKILNPAVLPSRAKFGRPMCFKFVEYPGSLPHTLIVGTDNGKLVEGTVQMGPDEKPFFRVRRRFLAHQAMVTSFAVSPDQRYLASSSLDGTMCIWRLTPPRVLGDVGFVTDGTSISFLGEEAARAGFKKGDVVQKFDDSTFYERFRAMHDGKYTPGMKVAIGIKRWDTTNGEPPETIKLVEAPDLAEPLLNLFLSNDDEWVAWTKNGMYTASSQGAEHVGWHVNNSRAETATFYRFDQFQQHLYQRKIVEYTLQAGDTDVATNRIRAEMQVLPNVPLVIDASNGDAFQLTLPPEVLLLSPPAGETEQTEFTMKGEITPRSDLAVQDVHFTVNSRPAEGRPQKVGERRDDNVITEIYEQQIELKPGSYDIALVARNSKDLTDRQSVKIRVLSSGQQLIESKPSPGQRTTARIPLPDDAPNLFVLAVGVSDYKDEQFTLRYSHRDAEEFVSAWKAQEGRQFAEVTTRLVTNENATVPELKLALNWLTKQAVRPSDTAVILLSGHGVFDTDDTWYFGTHELNPSVLFQSAISFDELHVFLRKIRSNLIVFADTCHGGAFGEGVELRTVNVRRAQVWHGAGTLTYASCLPEEESFEHDSWKHGAFTKAILEFVRGTVKTDYDKNGMLSFSEMQVYVNSRVKELTQGRQNPDVYKPSGMPDVNIARAP